MCSFSSAGAPFNGQATLVFSDTALDDVKDGESKKFMRTHLVANTNQPGLHTWA